LNSPNAVRTESNASGYLLLWRCVGDAAVARWVAVGLGVAWLCRLGYRERDLIRYLMGALTATAVLTPVLHPWYLVWLVPCFVLWRPPALVALTGSVVLAYTVWPGWLERGVWAMPMWARLIEYGLPAIVGAWSVWRVRRCVWPLSFRLATRPRRCPAS
jgi:hypothetical protein